MRIKVTIEQDGKVESVLEGGGIMVGMDDGKKIRVSMLGTISAMEMLEHMIQTIEEYNPRTFDDLLVVRMLKEKFGTMEADHAGT